MGYVEDLRALVGHHPVILVAGAVLLFDQQERVLLIERTDDGNWSLPGGMLEPGETVEQAARRETLEEIGVRVKDLEFVGIFSGPEFFHTYPNGDEVFGVTVVYWGRYSGETLRLDPAEVSSARLFALDALPAKQSRRLPFYLEGYAALERNGRSA